MYVCMYACTTQQNTCRAPRRRVLPPTNQQCELEAREVEPSWLQQAEALLQTLQAAETRAVQTEEPCDAQAEALRHAEAHQRAAVSAQADREAAAAALSKAARLEAAAAKKADEENIAAAAEEEKRRQTLASRKEAGKWLKKTKGKKKAEKEESAEESGAEED